jgi:uncharacterized membrane protein HdeD (DUF308 family)
METNNDIKEWVESVKQSAKSWWVFLIYGILLIGFSLWMLFTSLGSYIEFTQIFSLLVFANGIAVFWFSISNWKTLEGWGWYFSNGIIAFIIGTTLILYPDISYQALSLIVGFWLMIKSVFFMGTAFRIKSYGYAEWGSLLFFAALLAIFSFILILNPVMGALDIVLWTALAFLFFGIACIILSFRLKKVKGLTYNKMDEIKARIKEEAEGFKKEIKSSYTEAGEEGKKIKEDMESKFEEFVAKILRESPKKNK